MRIHQVVVAVSLVLSMVGAAGCAAHPESDETEASGDAFSAAAPMDIDASDEAQESGIQHWTYAGLTALSGTLTPIDADGNALDAITFAVKGSGDARVSELRTGGSVVRVAADGTVLEMKVDAQAKRMFELTRNDLQAFIDSDETPYGSCRTEQLKLALAVALTVVACGTSPATAGIACALAVAGMLIQASETGEACRKPSE
jgi:hypothetical protein